MECPLPKQHKKISDYNLKKIYSILAEMGLLHEEEDDIVSKLEKKTAEVGLMDKIQQANRDYFNTPTKKEIKRERKSESRGGQSKKGQSHLALNQFINSQYNRLYNSRFSFNMAGDMMYVMDLNKHQNLEHRFIRIDSVSIFEKTSLYSMFKDVFDFQDAWSEDINFKRDFIKSKRMEEFLNPEWIHRKGSYRPEMKLSEGGFVTAGTWKKFDEVPALLCRNEIVWTQKAVRGMGRGSYLRGAQFGGALMMYFEKEAAKYSHER